MLSLLIPQLTDSSSRLSRFHSVTSEHFPVASWGWWLDSHTFQHHLALVGYSSVRCDHSVCGKFPHPSHCTSSEELEWHWDWSVLVCLFVAGKGSEGATCDTFSNQGRMRICSAHWQISNLSNYFTIKDMLSWTSYLLGLPHWLR